MHADPICAEVHPAAERRSSEHVYLPDVANVPTPFIFPRCARQPSETSAHSRDLLFPVLNLDPTLTPAALKRAGSVS